MKKSYITNLNSNNSDIINKYSKYLPLEGTYEKITSLDNDKYDYIYITNFKDNNIEDFTKLFSNSQEEYIIDNDSYDSNCVENIVLAFHSANYTFKKDIRFEEKKAKIVFSNTNDELNEALEIAKYVNMCKDLVNEPSNYLTTKEFTKRLEKLAKELDVNFDVIEHKQLEKDGAGGILAVNQGSKEKARIVKLEYNGNKDTETKYALVGKGLVFDTGGYSLKRVPSIVNMKSDMGGAAVVSTVFAIIASLKLKLNLVVFIPITDNLINEKAYRPDDVITFRNKLTAEIISTDAEGRLALADALTYACEEKPELVIDVATLTGAVIAALGSKTFGVFGNNNDYINKLIETSNSFNEYAWQLPIYDCHRKQIEGKIATLKNSASPAGSSTAAAFLENFIEDNNWLHLDIAGVAFDEKNGATGAVVRPLFKYLKQFQ